MLLCRIIIATILIMCSTITTIIATEPPLLKCPHILEPWRVGLITSALSATQCTSHCTLHHHHHHRCNIKPILFFFFNFCMKRGKFLLNQVECNWIQWNAMSRAYLKKYPSALAVYVKKMQHWSKYFKILQTVQKSRQKYCEIHHIKKA